MTMTINRADWDTPATEPEDNRRATVKVWRRELADWLRAHGMTAAGPVWDSTTAGERDLTSLRRIAAGTDSLARHWSGHVMPAGLADGDSTEHGVIVGCPVSDPETGTVWVVTRRVTTGLTDHDTAPAVADIRDVELAPGVPVHVTRGRGTR